MEGAELCSWVVERRQLSSTAANRRCLLLDGAGCHSVRAFREGGGREAEEIVVPNVVSTTYQSIQEQVSVTASERFFVAELRIHTDAPLCFRGCARRSSARFGCSWTPTRRNASARQADKRRFRFLLLAAHLRNPNPFMSND